MKNFGCGVDVVDSNKRSDVVLCQFGRGATPTRPPVALPQGHLSMPSPPPSNANRLL